MIKSTLIFDIGKTNKKCFLFDEAYQEVYRNYIRFDELQDEEGFPCDNLEEIKKWIFRQFEYLWNDPIYDIQAINFSTYGASFVHLDEAGNLLTPLYNYLKPFPAEMLQDFLQKYGPESAFALQTASPVSGMLNSGLQLYWLKYARPEIFAKIHTSLHFPQYLSYLFSQKTVSEYTSIGCHTGLWDYAKKDYHDWVYAEGIDKILAPIVPTDTQFEILFEEEKVKMGVGIHDSSAALYPYLHDEKEPFLLMSTGTWSVSLNPFGTEILTETELAHNCLNYMRIDGKAVKAARLFLGKEYAFQVAKLAAHFDKPADFDQKIQFDPVLFERLKQSFQQSFQSHFHFEHIPISYAQPAETPFSGMASYEEAYHQLMMELVEIQLAYVRMAMGETEIPKIYIDGGFAENELFVRMLELALPAVVVQAVVPAKGSALGAAMVGRGL